MTERPRAADDQLPPDVPAGVPAGDEAVESQDDESVDPATTAPVSRQWAREQRQGGNRRKASTGKASTGKSSTGKASTDRPATEPTAEKPTRERRSTAERRVLPPPVEPSPSDVHRSVERAPTQAERAATAAAGSTSAGSTSAGKVSSTSRPAPHSRLGRRGTVVFSVATLVFMAGLASLVWKAYSTSLDIKGGASIGAETDPTKPGYEAQVKANATYLVAGVDDKGRLTDAMLVVPGGSKGGVVMFIPGVTLIQDAKLELSTYAAQNGLAAAVTEIEKILGCAISNTITADSALLTTWFTPLGSLTIDNPDTLVKRISPTDTQIVFGQGSLTLKPEDVSAYLSFVSEGEPGINRVTRLQTVTDAWMKAIAANPAGAPKPADVPSAVGGQPLDAGTLFSELSAGTVGFQTLPTQAIPIPGTSGARVYQPDAAAMKALLSSVVPYPTSAFPGQRPRVRIFNGTADLGAATKAAPGIIDLGAEITVFGNWKDPTIATTDVQYNSATAQAVAESIAAKYGVTAVGSASSADAYDITVVLGADVAR